MDEVKLAAAQYNQNRSTVVCCTASTASVTRRATFNWLRRGTVSPLCSRLRHCHRRWSCYKIVLTALLLFDNYAAFNVLLAGRFYCLSSRHLCCHAWTIGVQLLQAFPNTCWIVSSRFSMQKHVSFAKLARRPRVSTASGTTLVVCS